MDFLLSTTLLSLWSSHFRSLSTDLFNDSDGSFLKLFWYLNSATFIVGQSSRRYYCAVTIGEDSVISAFRLVRQCCNLQYNFWLFSVFVPLYLELPLLFLVLMLTSD